MNPKQKQRGCDQRTLRVTMALIGACLAGYIVGPPLFWHFTEVSLRRVSCPPCLCDCSSQPLLSLPEGVNNTFFTDCMKRNPEVSEEIERKFTHLLSEELKLSEARALENQRRADMAVLEAKKMASQYQKEADKCNSGMETCEEAREKAEAALEAQREITAKWELIARHKGWKDGPTKSRVRMRRVRASQNNI